MADVFLEPQSYRDPYSRRGPGCGDAVAVTKRRLGCDVVEAFAGLEALIEVLVRPPTAVVCELRLPIVAGCVLCDILRRDRSTARIPILVVATETGSTQLEHARRADADMVLTKPRITRGSSPDRRSRATVGPDDVNVAVGATVTWMNSDSVSPYLNIRCERVELGNCGAGRAVLVCVSNGRNVSVHCAIHPGMIGTVIVH
jgi:CheY-like chemotaxis protein